MRNKIILAAVGTAALAAGSMAISAEPVSSVIQIRGVVPTICRAEFAQPAVSAGNGVVALGQMAQLCNQIGGYRVVMQHPANLGTATVTVDGITMPLSAGNETVLVDINHPAERVSDVSLSFPEGDLPGSLSFRTEPKGAIY